jgi:hypothetical protein
MTKTSTGPARFHAYDLSLQLVTAVRLASASWRTVGDLADQGRRASISIALPPPRGICLSRRFTVASSVLRYRTRFLLRSGKLFSISLRCSGFDTDHDRAASVLAGRVAAMTTALVRRR